MTNFWTQASLRKDRKTESVWWLFSPIFPWWYHGHWEITLTDSVPKGLSHLDICNNIKIIIIIFMFHVCSCPVRMINVTYLIHIKTPSCIYAWFTIWFKKKWFIRNIISCTNKPHAAAKRNLLETQRRDLLKVNIQPWKETDTSINIYIVTQRCILSTWQGKWQR